MIELLGGAVERKGICEVVLTIAGDDVEHTAYICLVEHVEKQYWVVLSSVNQKYFWAQHLQLPSWCKETNRY